MENPAGDADLYDFDCPQFTDFTAEDETDWLDDDNAAVNDGFFRVRNSDVGLDKVPPEWLEHLKETTEAQAAAQHDASLASENAPATANRNGTTPGSKSPAARAAANKGTPASSRNDENARRSANKLSISDARRRGSDPCSALKASPGAPTALNSASSNASAHRVHLSPSEEVVDEYGVEAFSLDRVEKDGRQGAEDEEEEEKAGTRLDAVAAGAAAASDDTELIVDDYCAPSYMAAGAHASPSSAGFGSPVRQALGSPLPQTPPSPTQAAMAADLQQDELVGLDLTIMEDDLETEDPELSPVDPSGVADAVSMPDELDGATAQLVNTTLTETSALDIAADEDDDDAVPDLATPVVLDAGKEAFVSTQLSPGALPAPVEVASVAQSPPSESDACAADASAADASVADTSAADAAELFERAETAAAENTVNAVTSPMTDDSVKAASSPQTGSSAEIDGFEAAQGTPRAEDSTETEATAAKSPQAQATPANEHVEGGASPLWIGSPVPAHVLEANTPVSAFGPGTPEPVSPEPKFSELLSESPLASSPAGASVSPGLEHSNMVDSSPLPAQAEEPSLPAEAAAPSSSSFADAGWVSISDVGSLKKDADSKSAIPSNILTSRPAAPTDNDKSTRHGRPASQSFMRPTASATQRVVKKPPSPKSAQEVRPKHPQLTAPLTPQLKTNSRIKPPSMPSTTTQQLERIAKERAEFRRELVKRRDVMEKSKTYHPPTDAVDKPRLTQPESPHFVSDDRPGAERARQLKEAEEREELEREARALRVRRGPIKLTHPKPFKLSTSKHAGEKAAQEEFVPLAARVHSFLHKTPKRFQPASKAGPPPPMEKTELKLTEPSAPKFHTTTRQRQHKENVLSQAEREEQMMREMKPFKARPVSQKVLHSAGDLGVPKVAKRAPCVSKGFVSHTEKRAGREQVARPRSPGAGSLPGRGWRKPRSPSAASLGGRPRSNSNATAMSAPKLTEVRPFKFSTDRRAAARPPPAPPVEEPPKKFVARKMPDYNKTGLPTHVEKRKPVEQQPFNLASLRRHEEAQREIQERLKREAEEEDKARRFKARPIMTSLDVGSPRLELPEKPLTDPKTPACLRRSLDFRMAFQERLRELEAEEARTNAFHARPLPKSTFEKAFSPKLPHRVAGSIDPQLASDARALARAEFDRRQRERELALQQEKEAEERLKLEEEERSIKEYRKTLVHKARPVPQYGWSRAAPAEPPTPPPLTHPESPVFATDQRLGRRDELLDELLE